LNLGGENFLKPQWGGGGLWGFFFGGAGFSVWGLKTFLNVFLGGGDFLNLFFIFFFQGALFVGWGGLFYFGFFKKKFFLSWSTLRGLEVIAKKTLSWNPSFWKTPGFELI